jgi:hypothetical protein
VTPPAGEGRLLHGGPVLGPEFHGADSTEHGDFPSLPATRFAEDSCHLRQIRAPALGSLSGCHDNDGDPGAEDDRELLESRNVSRDGDGRTSLLPWRNGVLTAPEYLQLAGSGHQSHPVPSPDSAAQSGHQPKIKKDRG